MYLSEPARATVTIPLTRTHRGGATAANLSVSGTVLTVDYPGALDGGSTPSPRDFVVLMAVPGGEAAIPVTAVSVDGDVVSLALARPVRPDETNSALQTSPRAAETATLARPCRLVGRAVPAGSRLFPWTAPWVSPLLLLGAEDEPKDQ